MRSPVFSQAVRSMPWSRQMKAPCSVRPGRTFFQRQSRCRSLAECKRTQGSKSLYLESGATMIPHAEKADKGGEDAYFISKSGLAVGVADGVGGSGVNGIDPGEYSRSLMEHAQVVADAAKDGISESPQYMMKVAHRQTVLPGSSTACILSLNSLSDVLLAANLGDSGFFVLHGNQVSFKTTPQQYGFNFPYQLALNTFVANRPEQAQGISLPVQPRDVIVIGTDGLWDNLFLEECVEVVTECQNQGLSPEEIAKSLATHAQMRSVDKDASSPFQESAEMNGLEYPNGGKPDDITVIVSVVKETQSQSQTGRID